MSTQSTLGPQVLLIRHGETEWSRTGRHTGRSDIPLTAEGEQQAAALAAPLSRLPIGPVLVSPLQRARRTADLAGLTRYEADADLQEWDYGSVEGITTKDFRREHPGWLIWKDGAAGGETIAQVGARADRVLARVEGLLGDDHLVVLVAHGHLLRVLGARWLGLAPDAGALLRLDPATFSRLGFEHDQRVLLRWNCPV